MQWDQEKDEANRRRHGIRFEAAQTVFDDPMAVLFEDPYPYEQRWRTIGLIGPMLVVVVHTWTEAGDGRIISARKADRRERRAYEEELR